MTIDDRLEFFEKKFDSIAVGSYSRGDKHFISDGESRLCRFCQKDEKETTFKNESHAIPERLGNHQLILLDECDECNKFFSEKLEDHLDKFTKPSEDVFAAIKIQAEQKDLTLNKEIRIDDELLVSGDAFRLKQILYNVLSNAVKFTRDGSVTLEAKAKEFDHVVRCVIKITDSGIGMDEPTLNRIFNQFEQASASTGTLFGGTGLGAHQR